MKIFFLFFIFLNLINCFNLNFSLYFTWLTPADERIPRSLLANAPIGAPRLVRGITNRNINLAMHPRIPHQTITGITVRSIQTRTIIQARIALALVNILFAEFALKSTQNSTFERQLPDVFYLRTPADKSN